MNDKIDAGKLLSVLVPAAVFILCGVVFLFLCQAMNALAFPGALDMQPGFTYEAAYRQIAGYTGAMKSLYFGFQTTDVVFLLAYGFLFARIVSLAARELGGEKTRLARLALVPIAAAVCDVLENAGIFTMIRLSPEPFPTLAGLTSAVGIAKFVLFGTSVALAAAGGAAALVVRGKKRGEEKRRA